jgi:hypothetical protein
MHENFFKIIIQIYSSDENKKRYYPPKRLSKAIYRILISDHPRVERLKDHRVIALQSTSMAKIAASKMNLPSAQSTFNNAVAIVSHEI